MDFTGGIRGEVKGQRGLSWLLMGSHDFACLSSVPGTAAAAALQLPATSHYSTALGRTCGACGASSLLCILAWCNRWQWTNQE